MTDEIAPQDLRVSHEEREHVAKLLAAHFSEAVSTWTSTTGGPEPLRRR